MRRRRVLWALAPLAGAASMLLGVGLGWNGCDGIGELLRDLSTRDGLSALGFFSFCSTVLTMSAHGLGTARGRPFHAGKASAIIAGLLFVPGLLLGLQAAAWASC